VVITRVDFIINQMSYSIFVGLMSVAFVDAINPTAIAMTIVILSSENQKILKAFLYCLGIFVTSLTIGLILSILFQYYGESLISNFQFNPELTQSTVDKYLDKTNPLYILFLFIGELIFGIICIYFALKNRNKSIVTKIKSYTDKNLLGAFKLGIVITGIEVATGLPYIGAITTMHVQEYNWFLTTMLLISYNIVFVSPVIFLIVLYKYFKTQFDAVTPVINKIIEAFAQLIKFYLLLLLGILSTCVGLLGVYAVITTNII
jgi:cytochrome c biogenesis protein CcdA